MRKLKLIVLAIACVGACHANRLIGWTDPVLGVSKAVTIDEHTGEAVVIGEVAVPAGYSPYSLTFDPVAGRFYGVALATSGVAAPSKLAIINPENGQISWLDVTGHPGGPVYFEGIEYSPLEGAVVASFASPGSYLTTRMCKLDLNGAMTAYTGFLPYADADTLAAQPETGSLFIFDINNPTNGFKLNRIDDPFGTPSLTGYYSGPADVDRDTDVAGVPGENPFVTRGDRLMQVDFDEGNLVEVGPYGTGLPAVRGIASVPNPWTVVSGTITLGDFVGSPEGRRVEFELYENGIFVDSLSETLDASGEYRLATDLVGEFYVRIHSPGWLARLVGPVTLDGTRLRDHSVGLVNGDIDRDNAVTVFDYNVLSDHFDRTSDDPDWSDAGPGGLAPADADIDGDGAVTVYDYNILSNNFDMVGD